jgi:hypothetical protein
MLQRHTTQGADRMSRPHHLVTSIALAVAALGAAFTPTSASAAASGSPAWCAYRCGGLVADWSAVAYRTIQAANGYADPMAASRVLAMVHLAMHDAANTAEPRYATYTPSPAAPRDADAAVAAASAAHDLLLALFPQQQAMLAAALDTSLADAPKEQAAGRAVGKAAAERVLARRAKDGHDAKASYQPRSGPGRYQYTPGFDFAAAPQWARLQPFALSSPQQFRVAPPPALGSAAYARDYSEVKETGSARADARRSADQTEYAHFWYEFSDIGWNRIARTVAREHKQDLWQSARSFALLNAAMADAYIAGWDSKFHHDFWRPVTAIRAGAADGNAATVPDAGFTPLLPTPPVQDHPSTHSALGAAAAVVLAHAFGRDEIRFAFASSSALPGRPVREFRSFSSAAEENADSRVRAGIHFRAATVAGLELGRQIGRYAVNTMLKPLPAVQAQGDSTACRSVC